MRSYEDLEERETGIEPATSSLGSLHSTAELLPLVMKKKDCQHMTYAGSQNKDQQSNYPENKNYGNQKLLCDLELILHKFHIRAC